MTEKRKFIYTLVIIFIVFFAWYYFFYYPLQTGIRITESEMVILQSRINSIRELSKNMEQIRKQENNLRSDILIASEKIIDQKFIKNLVNLLEKEMQKYNIKILAVSPIMTSLVQNKFNQDSFNYKYLPLNMKIEARFLDVAKFLDDLNHISVILKPEGISMLPNNENSEILSIDLRAKILIKTGNSHENI